MSIRVGQSGSAPPRFPKPRRSCWRIRNCGATCAAPRMSSATSAAVVVGEMPDWEAAARIRAADQAATSCAIWMPTWNSSKPHCTAAGGQVHWARDADEANRIIVGIIQAHERTEVIKVKTMTSDETQLNVALEAAGITPYETDLADLIIQLGDDKPSHIVVPALHRNKSEIRKLFMEKMGLTELGDKPEDLAAAARNYLRETISAREGRLQRRELRGGGNGLGLRGRIGRQRAHVRDAAGSADHDARHREDHSHRSTISKSFCNCCRAPRRASA